MLPVLSAQWKTRLFRENSWYAEEAEEEGVEEDSYQLHVTPSKLTGRMSYASTAILLESTVRYQ